MTIDSETIIPPADPHFAPLLATARVHLAEAHIAAHGHCDPANLPVQAFVYAFTAMINMAGLSTTQTVHAVGAIVGVTAAEFSDPVLGILQIMQQAEMTAADTAARKGALANVKPEGSA